MWSLKAAAILGAGRCACVIAFNALSQHTRSLTALLAPDGISVSALVMNAMKKSQSGSGQLLNPLSLHYRLSPPG